MVINFFIDLIFREIKAEFEFGLIEAQLNN